MDAVLVVTPYYNKPPLEGILRHTEAIAEAAGELPVMLYNIPQRVVLELSIRAAVAARGDPERRRRQAGGQRPRIARAIVAEGALALYAGNDDVFEPFLELGGAGGVSSPRTWWVRTCGGSPSSWRPATSRRRGSWTPVCGRSTPPWR